MVIEKGSGLSTLSHNYKVPCHQMLLKTFFDPGYLCSEDGIAWLPNLLVNVDRYIDRQIDREIDR